MAEPVDLVEALRVYRLPKLGCAEIRAMLNLVGAGLIQTQFYREFSEGHREESTSLILRQPRRRFGAVVAVRATHIQRLSLAEALLDFQTPADLAAWLAEQENGDF